MNFPLSIMYNGVEMKVDLTDQTTHPLQFTVTSPVSMISGIDTFKMLGETKEIIDKYFKLTGNYKDAYYHLAERVQEYCLEFGDGDRDEIEVDIFRLVVGQFIEQQVERRTDAIDPKAKKK